ncbi:VG15 protein [Trueperella pyogenes]
MLMVDHRALSAKRAADAKIERALLDELDQMWELIKGWDRLALDNALVELLPGLVDKYGAAYAEVAAQWFETLIGQDAILGKSFQVAQIQRSVRWALKPYLEGAALDAVKGQVAASLVRHAMQAGRDTIDASVRATKGVLYARVLSGLETCDFCTILASRGPVYGTARDAGDVGNRYHDRCDCQAVPVRGRWVPDRSSPRGVRWVGEDPGYDFEGLYLKEYKPYWRDGLSLKQVVERRVDTRASEPWGGVTWLEDLRESKVKPPAWWDNETRQKTLIGRASPTKPGRWNGGHGYGRNVQGKTEFPERWTDDDIDLILAETWQNPTAVRNEGDRRRARRVIDGVLVEVSAYGFGYKDFRAYFTVGGRGVFYNESDGSRLQKRIPKDAKKWEVLR